MSGLPGGPGLAAARPAVEPYLRKQPHEWIGYSLLMGGCFEGGDGTSMSPSRRWNEGFGLPIHGSFAYARYHLKGAARCLCRKLMYVTGAGRSSVTRLSKRELRVPARSAKRL